MLNKTTLHKWATPSEFPGRWLGGAALIVGPLLLLLGVTLRAPFHFFFPEQLAAFQEHPALITAAYSSFAAGNAILLPAILLLANRISATTPGWAFWGATFAVFGLLARTFHAGIDHLAFQLTREQNVELAAKVIAGSYGAFHIFKTFNLAIMLGWIVLAAGAYRSSTLNLYQSVALALMSSMPLGVLKGSTAFSFVAAAGLCVALLPYGVQVLRESPKPSVKAIFVWIAAIIILTGFFYFFGQAG